MKVLLKGMRIVNPAQDMDQEADLLINNGVIEKVGSIDPKKENVDQEYDFTGKICVPGLYDMHVHLREPGREDKETVISGCNGAAAGGFTGVACMPNTTPAIDSAEVIGLIKKQAEGHLVDVDPVGAVTKDRAGESLAPIAELSDAGAVAFSDDGVAVKTAAILRNAFEYCSMYNAPIIEHCEDESLSDGAMNEGFVSTQLGMPSLPSVSEDLIVARDLLMAEYVDGRIHIAHISTKRSVELVRDFKKRGIRATAEVTPHHFTLTDESLKNFDTNFKMSPPLRTQEDVDAIIEGLKDGTIDCIASDHAPHTIEEKDVEFIYAPNGILGLETQVALTLSELYHKKQLTLDQVIEKLSINPRKILNLPVPEISEGAAANLTVIDLDEVWTADVAGFKSKSKNSPFDKRLFTGKAVSALNNCQMYYDGKFVDL